MFMMPNPIASWCNFYYKFVLLVLIIVSSQVNLFHQFDVDTNDMSLDDSFRSAKDQNVTGANMPIPFSLLRVSLSYFQSQLCLALLIENRWIISIASCLQNYRFEKNMVEVYRFISPKTVDRILKQHQNESRLKSIKYGSGEALFYGLAQRAFIYSNHSVDKANRLLSIETNHDRRLLILGINTKRKNQHNATLDNSSDDVLTDELCASSVDCHPRQQMAPNCSESDFHYCEYFHWLNGTLDSSNAKSSGKCVAYTRRVECEPCDGGALINNSFIGTPLMCQGSLYGLFVGLDSKDHQKWIFVPLRPYGEWIDSRIRYQELFHTWVAGTFWSLFIAVFNGIPVLLCLFYNNGDNKSKKKGCNKKRSKGKFTSK